MIRFGRVSAGLIVLSSQMANAVAQVSPEPLSPISKWQMDYASGDCQLIRSFGTDQDPVTLQFTRDGLSDSIELAIAGRRMPVTREHVAAAVGTSTVERVHGTMAQGVAVDGELASIRFLSDLDLPKALNSDVAAGKPTILSVKFVRGYTAAFRLGPMKAPLAALDACTDDLVKGWGIDVAAMREQRSPPQPANDVRTWFRTADYPEKQDRRGLGAVVIIRLIVGDDGTVRKCEVYKSGGDKTFEEITCRLAMERARFRPAIGSDGHPIASMWSRAIRWNPGKSFFTVE